MPQSAYTTAVLADSPWVFFKLDEASGNPQDSSGNARHVTSTDGSYTYQQTGPFSGSFGVFPANSSQFNVGTPAAPSATDNITAEMWLKAGSTVGTNNSFILGIGNGWNVAVDTDLTFQVRIATGATFLTNSTAALSTSAWKHIVCVRDSGTWKYYVNGTIDTANAGTTAPTDPGGGGAIIQFAQDFASDYQVAWSNFAYYTSALSSTQVAAHYDAGVGSLVKTGLGTASLVGAGDSASFFIEAGHAIVGTVGAGPKSFTSTGSTYTKAGRGIVGTSGVGAGRLRVQPLGVSIGFGDTVLEPYPNWVRIDA